MQSRNHGQICFLKFMTKSKKTSGNSISFFICFTFDSHTAMLRSVLNSSPSSSDCMMPWSNQRGESLFGFLHQQEKSSVSDQYLMAMTTARANKECVICKI